MAGDLNNSSGSEEGEGIKEDVGFNLFGFLGKDKQAIDNKEIYEDNKAYDDVPPHVKASHAPVESPPRPAPKIEVDLLGGFEPAPTVLTPPGKEAVAVDYARFTITSPEKEADEEEKLGKGPDEADLEEVEVDSSALPEKVALADD